MKEIPEILEKLDDLKLVDKAGGLYSGLGEDAVPALADHMDDMKEFQGSLSEVLDSTKAVVSAYKEMQAENEKIKAANTKLMFDQLKNKSAEPEQKKDDEVDKINDGLKNVTLEEE